MHIMSFKVKVDTVSKSLPQFVNYLDHTFINCANKELQQISLTHIHRFVLKVTFFISLINFQEVRDLFNPLIKYINLFSKGQILVSNYID